MTIQTDEQVMHASLKEIAKRMLLAARTAPKGRGEDNMVALMVDGTDIERLCEKMKEIGTAHQLQNFIRDAECIKASPVVLLFGTRVKALGLKKCGMCGFKDCPEKNKYPDIPCVFNTGDLGIAIGSAVSVAMDHRVDNRIMYSVAQAAMELRYFPEGVKVAYAVPLSATAKSPFFDRKSA